MKEYRQLGTGGVRGWLAAQPAMVASLGGVPEAWQVSEISDGNLNAVYRVEGPRGGVCVKQSLPFVRVVGEGWPMPLERAYFEQLYLKASAPHVGGLAPSLLHYDDALFAMAMELLPEHVILRRALVAGSRYPEAARCVGRYVARQAFGSSVLASPFERVNDRLAEFSRNHALTRITIDLIFTHPYVRNERNRWTSPQLDRAVAELQADGPLKAAVAHLAYRFLTVHESLLHGDLHTGSIMVSQTDTRVIDGEFAIYGPTGFDLGLFMGNLLMAYFSQPGHESRAGERSEHGEWILQQIEALWHAFVEESEALLSAPRKGDAYPSAFFEDASGVEAFEGARQRWFGAVLADSVGFAGAEIIRRIVGFAHNLDFESIADPARRADCERCALGLAQRLIMKPQEIAQLPDVIEAARELARRSSR